MTRKVTVLEISDLPGYRFEVNTTDENGEVISIDAIDVDDAVDRVREFLMESKK